MLLDWFLWLPSNSKGACTFLKTSHFRLKVVWNRISTSTSLLPEPHPAFCHLQCVLGDPICFMHTETEPYFYSKEKLLKYRSLLIWDIYKATQMHGGAILCTQTIKKSWDMIQWNPAILDTSTVLCVLTLQKSWILLH